jgi:hypothetical protein
MDIHPYIYLVIKTVLKQRNLLKCSIFIHMKIYTEKSMHITGNFTFIFHTHQLQYCDYQKSIVKIKNINIILKRNRYFIFIRGKDKNVKDS